MIDWIILIIAWAGLTINLLTGKTLDVLSSFVWGAVAVIAVFTIIKRARK